MRVSLALACALLPLAGCAADPPLRTEGVSFAAGDAIAANTVMQMVDPWDANVRYTDIAVPANREPYQPRQQEQAPAESYTQAVGTTNQ
ncbi:hypothetical protein [Chelativorans sp. M5D2P16]|uniref:hypothetical protein n=1 Tax=Chelativorans sp. M5D2P16 TaxID=3095678 RepID=UPI002ACAA0C0|nr:hypothetical protein [Chelativorans sp. M5D2P16]MDZ5696208.1 hypothetical protein [Chelativorans sp. M5D2P16]